MMFVDRNAALVILDSCRFQVQAFQVGHSSRCHHDLIDDKFVFVIAMLDDTMQTTVFLLDFLQLRTKTNIDAFFLEDFQHDFTRFGSSLSMILLPRCRIVTLEPSRRIA